MEIKKIGEMKTNPVLKQLIRRYIQLKPLESSIELAAHIIIDTFNNGGKVLVCGNGGSCSDADHIVGELLKGFERNRPLDIPLKKKIRALSPDRGGMLARELQQGLPAISLTTHNSLITAIVNDINGEAIFAQQVTGLGTQGDVIIGLSTSGNSQNVVDAFITAKAKEMKTIGMTGESGGKMGEFCDVLINVPERRTAFVQELHLPVYHAICMMVESEIFGAE